MARLFKREINFMGNFKIFFAISAALIAISIGAIAIRGLQMGIEFVGGTSIDFANTGNITLEQMRDAFEEAGATDAVIQTSSTGGSRGFLVRMSTDDPDVAAGIASTAASSLGLSADSFQVTTIGPDWGADIARRSLMAFVVSLVVIIIYVTIRFEFKMGVTAVAALFHDLIIVVGIYALLGREITPNVIAALLTILGYSLYDTIVVFHRICDNAAEGNLKCSLMKLANHSVNQVFTRTINTTVTSLLPVLIMLFFGGETLKDFAFAMSVGLICGSYSSIAIATPLYTLWKQLEPKYAKLAKKYSGDIVSTRQRKQLAQKNEDDAAQA